MPALAAGPFEQVEALFGELGSGAGSACVRRLGVLEHRESEPVRCFVFIALSDALTQLVANKRPILTDHTPINK